MKRSRPTWKRTLLIGRSVGKRQYSAVTATRSIYVR
jgi:hypothetical protein